MRLDDRVDSPEFNRAEAIAVVKTHGIEPELGPTVVSLDVHVRRLVPVMGEEEQPVRPRANDCGQLRSLAEDVWRRQRTVWGSAAKSVTEWAPAESFERERLKAAVSVVPAIEIVPLDRAVHDRAAFSCGQEQLDRYLREQAVQDVKKRVAAVFVAARPGKGDILGSSLPGTGCNLAGVRPRHSSAPGVARALRARDRRQQ